MRAYLVDFRGDVEVVGDGRSAADATQRVILKWVKLTNEVPFMLWVEGGVRVVMDEKRWLKLKESICQK